MGNEQKDRVYDSIQGQTFNRSYYFYFIAIENQRQYCLYFSMVKLLNLQNVLEILFVGKSTYDKNEERERESILDKGAVFSGNYAR